MSSEATPPTALSGSIIWARRQGASRLVVFTSDGAGDLARLATYFSLEIEVRKIDGAMSQAEEPSPLPVILPPPAGVESLLDELRSYGLEVVLENGSWRGELLGLEVARIVLWPQETGGDGELHIEVGVGRFDRDASAAMHAGESIDEALTRAVGIVKDQRFPGAGTHALSLMARPRWMRAAAIADPSVIGAEHLAPIETTIVASSVRDTYPAAALGKAVGGSRDDSLLAVFSTGASLDLVPLAADTRALIAPDADLRLVVPQGDRMGAIDDLATLLDPPAEMIEVTAEWT